MQKVRRGSHQRAADRPFLLKQALASFLPAEDAAVSDEEHVAANCFLEKRDEDRVNFSVFGNLDIGDHEDCGSLLGSARRRICYFSDSHKWSNTSTIPLIIFHMELRQCAALNW